MMVAEGVAVWFGFWFSRENLPPAVRTDCSRSRRQAEHFTMASKPRQRRRYRSRFTDGSDRTGGDKPVWGPSGVRGGCGPVPVL